MEQPKNIINGQWEIQNLIGKGGFSEIYLGIDIKDPNAPHVAIKVQNSNFDASMLKWESAVLKELKESSYVPEFIHFGIERKNVYLVMKHLSGEDMANLRNRLRNICPFGLIPSPIAVYLTIEMLKCIQDIHEKGFIHRDVKPSNFMRKNQETTTFSVIDFGLAKRRIDSNGVLKKERSKADFRGTTVYVSPFVHRRKDQCPRDDLFGIFYVFVDLLCGKLPWTASARAKDKIAVGNLKITYLSDIQGFIKCCVENVSEVLLTKGKGYTPQDFLSVRVQESIKNIFNYLKDLKYVDMPNYQFLKQQMLNCTSEEEQARISHINYDINGINIWKTTSKTHGKLPSTSAGIPTINSHNGDQSVGIADGTSSVISENSVKTDKNMNSAMKEEENEIIELLNNFNNSKNGDYDNLKINFKQLNEIEQKQLLKETIVNFQNEINSLGSISMLEDNHKVANNCNNIINITKPNEQKNSFKMLKTGVLWKKCVEKLFISLPLSVIPIEAFSLSKKILVENNHFMGCSLGFKDKYWGLFTQISHFVAIFYERYRLKMEIKNEIDNATESKKRKLNSMEEV